MLIDGTAVVVPLDDAPAVGDGDTASDRVTLASSVVLDVASTGSMLPTDDPRLDECRANVAPIADVVLRSPSSLSGGLPHDRANTQAVAAALRALGGTVRVASTTVQSGAQIEAFETRLLPDQQEARRAPEVRIVAPADLIDSMRQR